MQQPMGMGMMRGIGATACGAPVVAAPQSDGMYGVVRGQPDPELGEPLGQDVGMVAEPESAEYMKQWFDQNRSPMGRT